MFSRRSFTHLISRLLIAVMLLQLALPSWAAFSSMGKAGWIEVCATGGIKWIKLSDADASGASSSHSQSDHCLLCASTGAAPEFDAQRFLSASFLEETSVHWLEPAYRRYSGHAILSRAPPA